MRGLGKYLEPSLEIGMDSQTGPVPPSSVFTDLGQAAPPRSMSLAVTFWAFESWPK